MTTTAPGAVRARLALAAALERQQAVLVDVGRAARAGVIAVVGDAGQCLGGEVVDGCPTAGADVEEVVLRREVLAVRPGALHKTGGVSAADDHVARALTEEVHELLRAILVERVLGDAQRTVPENDLRKKLFESSREQI